MVARGGVFWGPLTAIGLATAAIACVLDQASKLWLLKVFDFANKGVVKVAPFVDLVLTWNTGISYGWFQQEGPFGQAALLAIKGVAVAESARGAGLGQALLRRIVQIYDQVDYRLLYGQFSVGSGLETYYARQGFEVLGEQAGVPLGPVFDLPITVGAPPGERLFVRWNPSRRR